jgi:hypothetical protein
MSKKAFSISMMYRRGMVSDTTIITLSGDDRSENGQRADYYDRERLSCLRGTAG